MLTLSKEMSFPGSREGGTWEQHQGMQERVHGLLPVLVPSIHLLEEREDQTAQLSL